MTPKPEVVIVDGHSMIFQWPELSALHQTRQQSARQRLIELMARMGDITGRHVVIVFDGSGKQTQLDSEEYRVQVFYSGAGKTADHIIERLVAKYSEQYRIIVATDDNLERTTVGTFGGEWMSSRQLKDEIDSADREISETLERIRRFPPRR